MCLFYEKYEGRASSHLKNSKMKLIEFHSELFLTYLGAVPVASYFRKSQNESKYNCFAEIFWLILFVRVAYEIVERSYLVYTTHSEVDKTITM